MLSKSTTLLFGGIGLVLIPSFVFIFDSYTSSQLTNYAKDVLGVTTQDVASITHQEVKKEKPPKREVQALYLTAHTAGNRESLDKILRIIDTTPLNALVIDIKDYTGNIYFDTQFSLPHELGIVKPVLGDLKGLIDYLHSKDIYVIARQTVFQDPALAQSKPEWALADVDGGDWKDWKGVGWVDMSMTQVWDYNIALAKDAITFGFDEINFDYIRFPSDGPIKDMKFQNYDGSFPKHEIVTGFFARLHNELKDEPAWLSGDLFGLTTVRRDDMSIGQLLESASPYFDYIMPMTYPSHYPKGYNKFENPAEHPYEILFEAVKVANERIQAVPNNKATIRPWIQDFDIGAVYDRAKVQAQIQAIKDAGGDGYASWNARNVYSINDYEESHQ
ncbi:putative glycoside hydrolase [Candidatus Falkowbacteria bacterium]|nr:putative glycoside hydrolase [Candidatus Falkowbacteria bacterium]